MSAQVQQQFCELNGLSAFMCIWRVGSVDDDGRRDVLSYSALRSGFADAAEDLHDDVRLVLYGLQRQADDGPCTAPKPWGW